MSKKIKIVLISFSLTFIVSIGWNVFKHYGGFGIPSGAVKVNIDNAYVTVEKKYNMQTGSCYLIGLWSSGDIFDGRNYFGVADNKANYNLFGEYKLSYFNQDKLVDSKNITKKNLQTISMDGKSKRSKIGLDRFKAPLKGKYNNLKIKLEIKNIQEKLRKTSQNIYFFIENTKCPDPFWTHKAELKNKKYLLIDNLETNSTLIPLYKALKTKNTSKVKELIQNGINPEAKMLGDRKPIHYATFFNDEKTLKYLISKGIDLNTKDTFRKTPLHYGIENNATKTVKLLLEHGADLSLVKRVDNYLNIKDFFGEVSVLGYVSLSYLNEMTNVLLENGLNPNDINGNYSASLSTLLILDKVVNKNLKSNGKPPKYPDNEKMVNLLRKYGAKTEDELKESNGVLTNTILINKKDK